MAADDRGQQGVEDLPVQLLDRLIYAESTICRTTFCCLLETSHRDAAIRVVLASSEDPWMRALANYCEIHLEHLETVDKAVFRQVLLAGFEQSWSESLALAGPHGNTESVVEAPPTPPRAVTGKDIDAWRPQPFDSGQRLKKLRQKIESSGDLRHADYSFVNLTGAHLSHKDLSYSNLSDATLKGAQLTGIRLDGAVLKRTNVKSAWLNVRLFDGGELRLEQQSVAPWSLTGCLERVEKANLVVSLTHQNGLWAVEIRSWALHGIRVASS
jgi:hypothetical protein